MICLIWISEAWGHIHIRWITHAFMLKLICNIFIQQAESRNLWSPNISLLIEKVTRNDCALNSCYCILFIVKADCGFWYSTVCANMMIKFLKASLSYVKLNPTIPRSKLYYRKSHKVAIMKLKILNLDLTVVSVWCTQFSCAYILMYTGVHLVASLE